MSISARSPWLADSSHPDPRGCRWQLPRGFFLVGLALAGLCGHVAAAEAGRGLDAWLPEGLYRFDCEILNQKNLVRIRHENGRMRVELLGDFKGSFVLEPKSDGRLRIADSKVDYPGLRRKFKGTGRVREPGVAEGEAELWLKAAGPVSRNHREGAWTLRPATENEIRNDESKRRKLEERRKRAQQATEKK